MLRIDMRKQGLCIHQPSSKSLDIVLDKIELDNVISKDDMTL